MGRQVAITVILVSTSGETGGNNGDFSEYWWGDRWQ